MTSVLEHLPRFGHGPAGRCYQSRRAHRWSDLPSMAFIGHHPTKTHERRADCDFRRLATAWGRGAYEAGYLYAGVGSHPEAIAAMEDPIGPDNDAILADLAAAHDLVVLAWGSDYVDPVRARHVAAMLWRVLQATCGSLAVLGWDNGQPMPAQHIPADTPLQCLTARAHPDFCDVDTRWVDLLADTGGDPLPDYCGQCRPLMGDV